MTDYEKISIVGCKRRLSIYTVYDDGYDGSV